MDAALINNWNARVQPNDTIYHLGDFTFKASKPIEYYRERLNGKIHLVRGNHDSMTPGLLESLFESVDDLINIKIDGQNIVLCHYAMRTWKRSHNGAWQLFGHSHGELQDDPTQLSMDVGVDCNNFFPVSFEEIREIMAVKIELIGEK